MNRKIIIFFVFLLFILTLYFISFSGCSDNSLAPQSTVSYSSDIQPIFSSSCSFPGCHNTSINQSGLDMTSWEFVMLRGSAFGSEIIPFNSKWSHLLMHINRVDTGISPFSEPLMPKAFPPYTNGQPLPRNIIEKIASWIDQGARNDDGQVAFSNITRKAFITNQASDYVAVVNLDNNHLVRLIDVGGRNNQTQPLDAPHVIIADNQGSYFYVSLIAEGFLEKYDAMTYERKGRMFVGASPAHIVLNDAGTIGYITDFITAGSIKVFDTQSMTIINNITEFRMKSPHGLRLTHNGNLLLCGSTVSEFLYIIRTSDNIIEDVAPVDPSVPPNGSGTQNFIPYQVAVTPDDKYAYVACRKSNDVRVFDIINRVFIQNIHVGLNPLALEISPDGLWCYVPNQASNSVSVIDLQSNTVIKTIAGVGVQPHTVDFTLDGHYAYVSCESNSGTFVHHPPVGSKKPGTTCVIDVWAGHAKIKDIEMASFPAGLSITPGKGN